MPNFSIFKEPRGFIRIIQLIFAIIAFAAAASEECGAKFSDFGSGKEKDRFAFFIATGVIAFLFDLAILVVYAFLLESLPPVTVMAELGFTALWSFFWLLASSLLADTVKDISDIPGCEPSSWQAAVVFGFINLICWVANIYYLFKETKAAPPVTNPADSGPAAV
ncbi:hypothetical protein CAOG_08250 [Capsaspora owczarzaki ATCC 30864]|uniref:Synaptophysin n=1 Tax=Capsaspora owczarzaki (strain ATCC 30864) TaxID=595528 RepID=A0A0D2WY20_CAPO3|nr:hypothetical protein CAOG_08250 [Capsaspora owczarzaki ATCC 30864]KJE98260.1 hypothetical protein CAOG_008250 [Capsaspora owczarzaki ATCC 30864]|eukprot:XP_004342419.1 hypothetical protein CAOG_08250 [Capsaspora owczarzaki ATCC 30864]